MIYTFIRERCSDMPVAVACRVMNVSTSGFYQRAAVPVTAKEADDAAMTETIRQIWIDSRYAYGAPRVHAELVLGRQQRCGRQRVERLMRAAQIQGIYRRRLRGCTKPDPKATPNPDLVERAFDPAEPNRLWCMDITEHPTRNGKISNGSKPGTTRGAATPTATTSAQSTTKPPPRHNHHNQPVRQTRGTLRLVFDLVGLSVDLVGLSVDLVGLSVDLVGLTLVETGSTSV